MKAIISQSIDIYNALGMIKVPLGYPIVTAFIPFDEWKDEFQTPCIYINYVGCTYILYNIGKWEQKGYL